MDGMARAGDEKPIETINFEGNQMQGSVVAPERIIMEKSEVRSGLNYDEEIGAQEMLKELELNEEITKGEGSMDEPLSLRTLSNIPHHDPVYLNYSFKQKPNVKLLDDYKDEIIKQIDANQVTIIKGATGCGKTTQIPQFILDQHQAMNMHCNIIVTQPRRIAAISVAKRVCEERDWRLGSLVGYQIALERRVSTDTRLLYCTTGVLLQNLVNKQSVLEYSHIILDEVHERDSEMDFILIILRRYLRNPQCRTKIIVMSGTIETDRFVTYFTRCIRNFDIAPPVIELDQNKKHNVTIFYLDCLSALPIMIPEVQLSTPRIDPAMYDVAKMLVDMFHVIEENDNNSFISSVLIFLPGIMEIETMYSKLKATEPQQGLEKWWLCCLHSFITNEEQMEVFKPAPKGYRKIILATNIAESSITLTDIMYVIDFCLRKQAVLEEDTNYASFEMTWVSKFQGAQRAGRVGRVMPGRVYRLISMDLYEDLPKDSPPEILRCPLDQLVLKAKQLNMGPPEKFLGLALDPPDLTNVYYTILNLKEMRALLLTANGVYSDYDGDLTFIGRIMATLPLDTRLSKLIIFGHMFSLLHDAIIMASALSVKKLFTTPFKRQLEAYNAKLTWADSSSSDPIAYLNAYYAWRHKKEIGAFDRSGGQTEEDWCRQYFIQRNVIKEVCRLEYEIIKRLKRLGLEEVSGDCKVTWSEVEKPIILKLIVAAAFYPNYFIPFPLDEKTAVMVLGGRDPFKTVYLTGLPHNQPGPLYINAIKKHFSQCGSNIEVTFDQNGKVYLHFGSSITSLSDTYNGGNPCQLPGKITLAVYRAIKIRQLQIPITISLLLPHEAEKRAEHIFGNRLKHRVFWLENQKKDNQMPAIDTNILKLLITHVIDLSKFWVFVNDDINRERQKWIYSVCNRTENNPLPPLNDSIDNGLLCIAPFTNYPGSGTPSYFRARIIRVFDNGNIPKAQVFFIDYGNQDVVSISDLRDFAPDMTQVKEEPGLALQATLAELGPSLMKNAKHEGGWDEQAIQMFKEYFRNNRVIGKIYSAVNNTVSLTLFSPDHLFGNNTNDFPFELSFNYTLIEHGFAEPVNEPYLSRENHILRETGEKATATLSEIRVNESYFATMSDIKFEPPAEWECWSRVILKGPRSPLEIDVYSLLKKCEGKEITVDWNSVNAILLDASPMDQCKRLLVAANVTQKSGTNRLTLRNTTMMPNFHGLLPLICMMFAPRVELRTDKEKKQLSGALCGLGFDAENGLPYYPENDIEITFDTKFTLLDIEKINKLRFWMDHFMEAGDSGVFSPAIVKSQTKIKEYTLDLLSKRRPTIVPIPKTKHQYEWDQLPNDEMLDPHGKSSSGLYPLIWGIDLVGEWQRDNTILARLDTLKSIADGMERMRSGTQCDLCQVYLKTAKDVKLHLATTMHRTKYSDFKESMRSNEATNSNNYNFSRYLINEDTT